jgi:hypothetical protein
MNAPGKAQQLALAQAVRARTPGCSALTAPRPPELGAGAQAVALGRLIDVEAAAVLGDQADAAAGLGETVEVADQQQAPAGQQRSMEPAGALRNRR